MARKNIEGTPQASLLSQAQILFGQTCPLHLAKAGDIAIGTAAGTCSKMRELWGHEPTEPAAAPKIYMAALNAGLRSAASAGSAVNATTVVSPNCGWDGKMETGWCRKQSWWPCRRGQLS